MTALHAKADLPVESVKGSAKYPRRTSFAMYISELTPTVYPYKKILIINSSKFELKLVLKKR